jgi:hypothetical protein
MATPIELVKAVVERSEATKLDAHGRGRTWIHADEAQAIGMILRQYEALISPVRAEEAKAAAGRG